MRKKGGVVHLVHSRGCCITFWPSIPPLQVAPSIACSVASLSRFPRLQLPRSCSLHHMISTDYLLGWGEPSTCFAGHAVLQCIPSPKHVQEVSLPALVIGRQEFVAVDNFDIAQAWLAAAASGSLSAQRGSSRGRDRSAGRRRGRGQAVVAVGAMPGRTYDARLSMACAAPVWGSQPSRSCRARVRCVKPKQSKQRAGERC